MANHIYRTISIKKFTLFRKDLKELRSKYRKINTDLPHSLLTSASRRIMIISIIKDEFTTKMVDKYEEQCVFWREVDQLNAAL